ncbi:predicted protein [Plenodomus lingam JN3]|uniref:Predicted protein n=1 Tax=Leptosphaeria maculans (strain JN3 / isolate v23.1.3 / race Av1-4-5-6-7-8) TaxID=985895 RepID=E4ZQR2_LEPMJ|nr:predicted protein [Plenodomus lingam JN3]CBX94067.1 predicted protein [Plenodomus lingam JN3]
MGRSPYLSSPESIQISRLAVGMNHQSHLLFNVQCTFSTKFKLITGIISPITTSSLDISTG